MNKKLDTTTVSSYFYSVNNLGQRSEVSQSGSAFASSRNIAWSYDSLGQVTAANASIPGLNRAYQFDMIGNRISGGDHGSPIAYTANALNQYSAIGSVTPAYDADGNATAYPLPTNLSANSILTWDAENRLISATVSGVTTNYRYDSNSRRIAIWRSDLQSLSSTLYDGWNPIAEYTGSVGVPPTLTKTYLWGMDLSGTMQGAGGVGGLLLITDHSALATSYFPTFDGNGNVSEYLNSTGAMVAHYEYDPFGKTTVATGAKAQDFSHRFSTKPLDLTTGLYYYGYRFYDPVTGRWPSRDPIEEEGGVNLYAFVWNDGLNFYDDLGLIGFQADIAALVAAGDVAGLEALAELGGCVSEQALANAAANAERILAQKLVEEIAKKTLIERLKKTAQEIISKELKGSVNSKFPEEMRKLTLEQIKKLAQQGDKAARTAWKLLNDNRFKK